MVVLFLVLGVICLWNFKLSNFHEDYITPKSTNAIKGIFAVIILFSHMNGYIFLNNTFADNSFSLILYHIGQLMVVMYFFYSGFGIVESMKKKPEYFDSYPRKRILKTVMHFDLAVLCFLLLSIIIDIKYPVIEYFTCWIGWGSIGNSNWFIFDILALYSIVYIAHLLMRKCEHKNRYMRWVIFLTSFLCLVLWIVLKIAGKGSWWVDTIITFPFGMWYSFFKEKIEALMKKKNISLLIITAVAFALCGWHLTFGNDIFGICACIFALLIVTVSTKIKLDNRILQWLGTQSFAIYIMQRLPMNMFQYLGLNENPYIFAAISIPSALLIAWGFNQILYKLDDAFFVKSLNKYQI